MIRTICILALLLRTTTSGHIADQFGAMEELGQGMSPRYFLDMPLLKNRNDCPIHSHHCQDINQPTICCPDSQYCYVNASGTAQCCDLESNCDNPCPSSQYRCFPTATVSGTATTTASCCARPCAAFSAFECSAGSGCCSLGFSCQVQTSGTVTANQCVSTAAPSTSAIVGIVPPGCTTGQTSCAASIGGGCCNSDAICTSQVSGSSMSLVCATGTGSLGALGTGHSGSLPSGISETQLGLSTGAKAGIGAGVGLVAVIIVCAALWFCMLRRRGTHRSPRSQSDRTESTANTGAGMSQTPRSMGWRGQADYFGPRATVGPYTDYTSPASTPLRGVPLSPDVPGDIMPAVEIGNSRDHSTVTSPLSQDLDPLHTNVADLKPVPETTEHRIELP